MAKKMSGQHLTIAEIKPHLAMFRAVLDGESFRDYAMRCGGGHYRHQKIFFQIARAARVMLGEEFPAILDYPVRSGTYDYRQGKEFWHQIATVIEQRHLFVEETK